MCMSTGNYDSIFFSRSYAPFNLEFWPKYTTETVCQPNSSETMQQNFMKLNSYQGHYVIILIIHHPNFSSVFLEGQLILKVSLNNFNFSSVSWNWEKETVFHWRKIRIITVLSRCAYPQEIMSIPPLRRSWAYTGLPLSVCPSVTIFRHKILSNYIQQPFHIWCEAWSWWVVRWDWVSYLWHTYFLFNDSVLHFPLYVLWKFFVTKFSATISSSHFIFCVKHYHDEL